MATEEKPLDTEDKRQVSTLKTGIIGETAVIHDLTISYPEFEVYKPIVDDKGVDILVYTGRSYQKVQVKTLNTSKTSTSLEVDFRKHLKAKHDIDIFAIFFTPIRKIAYIPWEGQARMQLAFKRAKNNQNKKRDSFYNYLDFPMY
jgi:predicted AAA+ superfamily ATPase